MPVAIPQQPSHTETLTQAMSGEYPANKSNGGLLKLRGHHVEPTTDAYPELDSKGFTVVKGVIPKERAAQYVERMYKWLESFGKGFDSKDRSTWHVQNLPNFAKGGLYHRSCVSHEDFAWDIRSEEGLIDAFAKIWNTQELLVSFDSVNISLPFPKEELEGDRGAAWPHVDQSPNRRFKHCIQGIMNLEENGPDDGGLMVLSGSLPLYAQYFEEHDKDAPEGGWTWKDSFHFKEEELQWFYDRGCKWQKVEASPGDLILWDSRCIHYGAAARGDRPRVATYVCYKPAKDIEPEMLETRKMAMKEYISTSHDPLLFRLTGTKIIGKVEECERDAPLNPPVLSDRAKQLAGILAY